MNEQDEKAFQEWKNAYQEEAKDHSISLKHLQKEIDNLYNYIEQLGKRLFPFSGYTEIGKILEEIKAINEIYKQNAKPESN